LNPQKGMMSIKNGRVAWVVVHLSWVPATVLPREKKRSKYVASVRDHSSFLIF
jgi:hypothetical protein